MRLYIFNTVKYRSGYFTGHPSSYINMKNGISKGEKNQRTTAKVNY